jgi:hypothetical protein
MVATSSCACSWVRLTGLTVVAIGLGGFAYCNQPWWTPNHHLDGLLTNCMPLHLPVPVVWLCGHSLFLMLRSVLVSVSNIMVGLDSFSLLRTVSGSYSTVLWGLFIPKHSWELDISFWFGPFASW